MDSLEDRVLASGLLPDWVLRWVIRARVRDLAESLDRQSPQGQADREAALVAAFEAGPIAIHTDDANRQHYDLPPEFFSSVLGPRLKYSCCHWREAGAGLAEAEEAMLELTSDRAHLGEGQTILDLGCGWGSLALWAAERYPGSRVVALSNSVAQRRFIESVRRERGLGNLEVVTTDVAQFQPEERFDRVVSVEMFEHLRNHRLLMERIADWLRPEGRLFVHVFCHRRRLYAFDPGSGGGWMAQRFFSGGVMLSWDYLTRYQDDLVLLDRWQVDGLQYSRTLRAWLENLDRHRDSVIPLLETVYGSERSRLWFAYWRVFFIACEETFALDSGRAYFVGHYLFSKDTRRR